MEKKVQEQRDMWEEVFLIYLDDDSTKKTKVALIQKEVGGITIRITEDGTPFFLPYNRILKIKHRTTKEDDNGNNRNKYV